MRKEQTDNIAMQTDSIVKNHLLFVLYVQIYVNVALVQESKQLK